MVRAASLAVLIVAFAGVAWLFTDFALYYGSAPQTVPTHFDFSGHPNRFGSKATLLVFPIFATLLLAGVAFVFFRGLPAAAATPVPAAITVLGGLVGAEIVWMLAFAQAGTFAIITGRAAQLGSGFTVALLAEMATVLALIVVSIALSRRS